MSYDFIGPARGDEPRQKPEYVPDAHYSRRNVLAGVAACAVAGVTQPASGTVRKSTIAKPADGSPTDGLRPFAWADALRRSDINAAEVSGRGDVALAITRPLGAPGFHFGWQRPALLPGGEIWLGNADLSSVRKLDLGARWAWSPAFSPSGDWLAALTTGNDGRVGLIVWDMSTGRARQYDATNIDIYGRFRSFDRAVRAPGFVEMSRQFVWIDDDHLLFLAAGEDETQFDLAGLSSSATYARLRGKTFDGEPSVRVWSRDGSACFAGRRLTRLARVTGEVATLHAANIRCVSLSGDMQWAALMQADHILPPDPDRRQDAPLRFVDNSDDPMVACSLTCVNLQDGSMVRRPEVASVGNMTASRMPIWSADSKRLAVPSRLTYSPAVSTGDDSCWEVDLALRPSRRWPAISAADAEFVATIVAANEVASVAERVDHRTPIADPPTYVGQIQAGCWVAGPQTIVKWVGKSLAVVRGNEEIVLANDCEKVMAPVALSDGGHMVLATRSGGRTAILLKNGGQRMEQIDLPKDAALLCAGETGVVVASNNAEDASRIYLWRSGRSARVSPFVLNRFFAEVRRPRAREIVGKLHNGRQSLGILQSPTNRPAGGKAPVIVWAYPDALPRLDGALTRLNSFYATSYPFQYLLAKGFAVFEVPLPMRDRPDGADPLDYVAQSIIPWLDILDQQPDIRAGEYGFWGHSDAGYAGLALEARTDRFKAIAATSTFPDLAATIYSGARYQETLDCGGRLIQANRFYYEAGDQRYRVGGSVWQKPERFVRSSALYQLGNAVTPMLLAVGEYDSVPHAMEEVYSVLNGKGVPTELAYYWGEGHLISSPGNIHDLWKRSESFFRKYLDTSK